MVGMRCIYIEQSSNRLTFDYTDFHDTAHLQYRRGSDSNGTFFGAKLETILNWGLGCHRYLLIDGLHAWIPAFKSPL